jgi:transketolase
MIQRGGVAYLRLDKTVAQDNNTDSLFTIGKAIRHKEGEDMTLIATGGILDDVNIAAVELKKLGINVRVVGMHSIKPIDTDEIVDAATNTGGIVTIEEHNKDGGLGSAVSEVCMDFGVMPKKFLRIGLDNMYSSIVGSQQYLRSRYHMDSVAIIDRVKEILKT